MTAKTTAERQRIYKDARRAEGLVELRGIYAHPNDRASVKALADKLLGARQGRGSLPPSGKA
jgi:hypothetical protein